MRFATSVEIGAAPERIWQVLTDVERWPEWTASVRGAQRLDDGPFALGSTVRLDQPRLRPAIWLVTELTPEASFTWASTSGGVTTAGEHRLTPTDNGRVRVELGIRHSGVLAPLVGLLTWPLTRKYMRAEADGLKSRCEQPTA